MSNATKCDRCGAVYKGIEGIVILPSHDDNFDLCADCMADLAEWMANDALGPKNGVRTDQVGANGGNVAVERVTKTPEMSHDTREQLEADVRKNYAYSTTTLMYPPSANKTTDMLSALPVDTVIGWLDRQAAITEQECREYEDALREQHHKRIAELKAERDELAQRIQTLEREIATLKEHRAANVERLRELTDANTGMAWRIQELEKELARGGAR